MLPWFWKVFFSKMQEEEDSIAMNDTPLRVWRNVLSVVWHLIDSEALDFYVLWRIFRIHFLPSGGVHRKQGSSFGKAKLKK